jgi:hypothetical protein
MGKGSKRRPVDEKKVAENWPFKKPELNGKKSYVWCQECKELHDVENWCGAARRVTKKPRTYGFALMQDCDPKVAKLLQHDQLDFATTTIEESAEKMRKDYGERNPGMART